MRNESSSPLSQAVASRLDALSKRAEITVMDLLEDPNIWKNLVRVVSNSAKSDSSKAEDVVQWVAASPKTSRTITADAPANSVAAFLTTLVMNGIRDSRSLPGQERARSGTRLAKAYMEAKEGGASDDEARSIAHRVGSGIGLSTELTDIHSNTLAGIEDNPHVELVAEVVRSMKGRTLPETITSLTLIGTQSAIHGGVDTWLKMVKVCEMTDDDYALSVVSEAEATLDKSQAGGVGNKRLAAIEAQRTGLKSQRSALMEARRPHVADVLGQLQTLSLGLVVEWGVPMPAIKQDRSIIRRIVALLAATGKAGQLADAALANCHRNVTQMTFSATMATRRILETMTTVPSSWFAPAAQAWLDDVSPATPTGRAALNALTAPFRERRVPMDQIEASLTQVAQATDALSARTIWMGEAVGNLTIVGEMVVTPIANELVNA